MRAFTAVVPPASIATWLARSAGITFARARFSRAAMREVRNRLFPGRDIPIDARCFFVVALPLEFSLGVDTLVLVIGVGDRRISQRRVGGKFVLCLAVRQRFFGGSFATWSALTRTPPSAPAAARWPILGDVTLTGGFLACVVVRDQFVRGFILDWAFISRFFPFLPFPSSPRSPRPFTPWSRAPSSTTATRGTF